METPFFFLPELWWEVLVRLPVKVLLRFRCVCKSWRSMIDSPKFVFTHVRLYKNNAEKNHMLVMEKVQLKRGQPTKAVVTIRTRNDFKVFDEYVQNYFNAKRVLDGCNGLVISLSNGMTPKLELWNPSTRRGLLLPSMPFFSDIFEYVLGFVPSSNDFKVVGFMNNGGKEFNNSLWRIVVYSLNDSAWRTKTVEANLPVSFVSNLVGRSWWHLFYQGAAYWMVSNDSSLRFWVGDARVLCFDFNLEEFRFFELPDTRLEMLRFLFVLGESLAVFGICHDSCCIWIMRNDGEKDYWTVWYSGYSSLDAYDFFRDKRGDKIISYDENSNTILLLSRYYNLVSYNVTSHKIHLFRTTCRSNSISRGDYSFLDTYVESLVLSSLPVCSGGKLEISQSV